MAGKTRNSLPLLTALILGLGAIILAAVFLRRSEPTPLPDRALANLGTAPDWSRLDAYHHTITRDEFERLLRNIYTIGNRWEEFITIEDDGARIRTSYRDPVREITIPFSTPGTTTPPPRFWRPASALPKPPAGQPLDGIVIALDPGHIGGEFAQLEERWYQIGTQRPVMEGEMALLTARHLKTRLEALGATVHLVRAKNAPVTPLRGADFLEYAAAQRPGTTPDEQHSFATRLFYRTAEIRARAEIVNQTLRPDLVLCLHYNAEAWGGDPSDPEFSDRNHFHLILNGAYTSGEVPHDDERFEMLARIFQGIHAEELALAKAVAPAFARETDLPPYAYKPNSARALPLDSSYYIWARNLLANRIYNCPVLFFEPYVMNSGEVFARVQAGDYDGTRLVAGGERKSIYREYADAVAAGLSNYYQSSRQP